MGEQIESPTMGSVQKRTYTNGKPARYIGRVKIGGQERTKSFDRKKDAEKWVTDQEALRPSRRVDNPQLRVALERRLKDPDVSQGTLRIRQHLANNLGDLAYLRIDQVSAEDVKRWRWELDNGRSWAGGKPLSRATSDTLRMQLAAVFNEAIHDGLIARNPARYKKRASTSERVDPKTLITEDEVRAMMKHATGNFQAMLRLGVVSGLRVGELCGLRRGSIRDGEVLVREQIIGSAHQPVYAPLKTPESVRDVPIPQDVADALETMGDPELPLFTSRFGIVYVSDSAGKQWRRTALKAGVTGHSWHSLRHFYATKLIQSGASVTTVQKRLGHTKPTVTLETYSHFWPGEDDRTREVFEDW